LMDLQKWQIDQSSVTVPMQDILNNKTIAKQHMFPKVSNLTKC